jgi:hypothetical protein|tara:strand:- start:68 stop:481 length:414 start_codon:yes stop_codon:yes gene_type:complete
MTNERVATMDDGLRMVSLRYVFGQNGASYEDFVDGYRGIEEAILDARPDNAESIELCSRMCGASSHYVGQGTFVFNDSFPPPRSNMGVERPELHVRVVTVGTQATPFADGLAGKLKEASGDLLELYQTQNFPPTLDQ